MDSDKVINQLEKFLRRFRQGEFDEDIEEAFRELSIFIEDNESAKYFLSRTYLPKLYYEGARGKQYLIFLAARTIDYDIPQLSKVFVDTLIGIYAQHDDMEILRILFDIILRYQLVNFINLESGKNLRVEAHGKSFLLPIPIIRSKYKLDLLHLVLKKYVRRLITSPSLEHHSLPSVIIRLNNVIELLFRLRLNETGCRAALLPFTLDNISYTKENALQLFGKNLTALEYDEWLFTNFRIPLFPFIIVGKTPFKENKLTFSNEGLGTLPIGRIHKMGGIAFNSKTEKKRDISAKICHSYSELMFRYERGWHGTDFGRNFIGRSKTRTFGPFCYQQRGTSPACYVRIHVFSDFVFNNT